MTTTNRRGTNNRLLCWLWSRIYRRWLWNDYYGTYDKVLKVMGWRTALVTNVTKAGREANRRCMSPCFWIFD